MSVKISRCVCVYERELACLVCYLVKTAVNVSGLGDVCYMSTAYADY